MSDADNNEPLGRLAVGGPYHGHYFSADTLPLGYQADTVTPDEPPRGWFWRAFDLPSEKARDFVFRGMLPLTPPPAEQG